MRWMDEKMIKWVFLELLLPLIINVKIVQNRETGVLLIPISIIGGDASVFFWTTQHI